MAKIYTKSGDKGKTGLVGGQRVSKHNIRLEAYGTVDELNSFVGLLESQSMDKRMKEFLGKLQYKLFDIGAYLATEKEDLEKYNIVACEEDDVTEIEALIDELNEELPKLKHFIMPGGHQTVAFCHIARTVCRRAERRITHLATEEDIDTVVVKYINRLSDLFFIMARKLAQDLQISEHKWEGF
ncbi:cob(I)alamin adenosyltransferase [Balneicella halophila]|uniref:Corrinoid adenosyltransferase n=1 Tax=Balneicella halophila TaxID=1537566 RepID=A0A7L4US24_BALHA|nr:cob(I)alamin adenosyltransferase [Balneicella halophila]